MPIESGSRRQAHPRFRNICVHCSSASRLSGYRHSPVRRFRETMKAIRWIRALRPGSAS